MNGSRPITKSEHEMVKNKFHTLRNKCLYILGKNTGFRISELLSITIGQVYKKDYVKVSKANVKGKTVAREVVLNDETKDAIDLYLASLGHLDMNSPLFISRQGDNKAITRIRGHQIFKKAFQDAQLKGTVTTHSCRKTFALKVFKASGNNLLLTSKALGHADLQTTSRYLPVDQEELNSIILSD